MSFDINWDSLVSDNTINDAIKEFLDYQFQNISLPSYIDNLSVTNFSLGTEAPEVTIRHIGDPFEDFYEDEDDEIGERGNDPPIPEEDSDSDNSQDDNEITTNDETIPQPLRKSLDSISIMTNHLNYIHNYHMNNIIGLGPSNPPTNGTETPTDLINPHPRKLNPSFLRTRADTRARFSTHDKGKHENDIQFIAEIKYAGDLHIEIQVNLLVNYPSPNFISLPIKLHITDIIIHSIATIAYLKNSVFFTFLCDVDDTTGSDYFGATSQSEHSHTPLSGGNFVDYLSGPNNRERIDIIKKIRIESEIGEVENNVLRNVGKVEKFLIDQLRTIIRDEVAWPGWICIDMNEEEEAEQEDE